MMQHGQRARRSSGGWFRTGPLVLGLGAALAVAGCGAGQITQMDHQMPAVNGALAQADKLVIRDATLVYPVRTEGVYRKGSDAELALTIINRSGTDDKLTNVSADAAKGATVTGSRVIVAGSSLVIGKPGEAGSGGAEAKSSSTAEPTQPGGSSAPSESGSPSETAPPASSAGQSQSTTAQPSGPAEVPTNSAQSAPGAEDKPVGHARIVLNDLTRQLRSGMTIRVTFTFEDAGPITLDLPIAIPEPTATAREKHEAGGEH